MVRAAAVHSIRVAGHRSGRGPRRSPARGTPIPLSRSGRLAKRLSGSVSAGRQRFRRHVGRGLSHVEGAVLRSLNAPPLPMTRSVALLVLLVSGCDATWVAPNAFSRVDQPLTLTLFDASGNAVATGEIDLDRTPEPDQPAEGAYRFSGEIPSYSQTGSVSAEYVVGADGCAEQLRSQLPTRISDAGLALVTPCEQSELRGEWFEVTIRGQELRGTFTLDEEI